jgi:Spy/CpxP family protein refolding chaperone
LYGVKGSSSEKAEKREQAMAMKDKRDQELKLVLTPEQYARMLELRTQKTAEMKARKRSEQSAPEAPPHNE